MNTLCRHLLGYSIFSLKTEPLFIKIYYFLGFYYKMNPVTRPLLTQNHNPHSVFVSLLVFGLIWFCMLSTEHIFTLSLCVLSKLIVNDRKKFNSTAGRHQVLHVPGNCMSAKDAGCSSKTHDRFYSLIRSYYYFLKFFAAGSVLICKRVCGVGAIQNDPAKILHHYLNWFLLVI